MASTITAGNATNGLALSCDNTGILELKTGTGAGTTAVTIGTGQEVAVTLGSAAAPSITFSGDTNTGIFSPGADRIGFAEGGVQVGEFDASGNLLVGRTSGSGARLDVTNSTEVGAFQNTSGTGNVRFLNSGGSTIGYIQWSGSSTSYVTSSDYRLKHDIQPMTGALSKVAQLKPVTYKWNLDDSESQGFIAHELQAVVPECVTGEKDAVDANGNPVYQGIDTSFLVATLTAAIQEQQAMIEELKAKVAALEGELN
jgi:hypothetical protein